MRTNESFEKLNLDQKQALDWTRSIAVRANAGSGKTSVLIQRIVQLLHAHPELKLDHIVAITFTRKAGAQLKERLHKALTECTTQSSSQERISWQNRLDELPSCPIGTIDSLCHRLLHAAIEDGMVHDLDPAFGILEGLDRHELLEQAIRRTELELKEAQAPGHAAWVNWITTQGRYDLSGKITGLLHGSFSPQACQTAYQTVQSLPREAVLTYLSLPALEEWIDHPSSHLDSFKEALNEILHHPKGNKKPAQIVQDIIDFLQNSIVQSEVLSPLQILSEMRRLLYVDHGKKLRVSGLSTRTEPYFNELTKIQLAWHKLLLPFNFEMGQEDCLDLTDQLIQIYAVAHRHFRDLCREENKYDFNFLADRTVLLLQDPASAQRLTARYRFILVDEFQDTNELQWQVISRLAGVDPEKPIVTDKLMIVGDPQQSIYRFRQADPTVFVRTIGLIQEGNRIAKRLDLPTAYDQHAGKQLSTLDQREGLIRLRQNYRSQHPLPLQIFDKLSAHAFDDVGFNYQHLEAGAPPDQLHCEVVYVVPETASDPADDPDAMSGLSDDSGQEGKSSTVTLDENQLVLVADELIRLHREYASKWGEMAILLRSRNAHFVNLEKTLRDRNIPYQLVGGLGFWQRQEVRDLVCLANCLANGSDELALFAVLRGPLIALDDSELLFLSMLGGRQLLRGLHRYGELLTLDPIPWEQWSIDAATAEALQTAFAEIGTERRAILQNAYQRLDYNGIWRQRVDRQPHTELIRTALDESNAWTIYTDGDEGQRCWANLQLFFDELAALEASRPASLADTARRLKTLVDESMRDEQASLTPTPGAAVQVMTVHAAKGLEFKVVAVIGLERKFNTAGDSLILLDRHQHLRANAGDAELSQRLHGLPVFRFRDPEMPLRSVQPLLHQALAQIERTREIEEEARIFHVAITRAKNVLILAGAGPKQQQKTWPYDNTWQRWVHDAFGWKTELPEKEWVDPADSAIRVRIVRRKNAETTLAPEESTPQPTFDLDPLRELPRIRTIAATSLKTMFELFHKDRDAWEMRYRSHVSAWPGDVLAHLVEGTKADQAKKLGAHIGTLVHRALEMGDAFPKGAKERRTLLLAHANALVNERDGDLDEPGSARTDEDTPLAASIANSAEKILNDVLVKNPFRGLLDAEGEPEVEFVLPIGRWIITGRFDRLIRAVDRSWEIVDWKTDDGTPQAIEQEYREQMKLYALALLESLPTAERPPEVRVHLALTHHRSERVLIFKASELEALRNQLEQDLQPLTAILDRSAPPSE